MMMIDSTMAVRFPAGSSFCSSSSLPLYRTMWSVDEITGIHISGRWTSHCGSLDIPCYQKFNGGSLARRKNLVRSKVKATAEHLGSASDPIKYNGRSAYHPFEDVAELASENDVDARLTPAETARTIVEVNTKATLLFSGTINDEIHENILWPELPYLTDEHGDVYIQVTDNEDILQTLSSDSNAVQVIVGLDTMEMLNDMEISGPAEVEFGIDEVEDEDSDFDDEDDEDDSADDDYEEDWVSVLGDEDDSDGNLGEWARLETMRTSHPMYFAKKLAEVASDDPVDCMERPPVGIAIQALLQPAVLEENSSIYKHVSGCISTDRPLENTGDNNLEDSVIIDGHGRRLGSSKDDSIQAHDEHDKSHRSGTSFYKLEMIKIQLLSVHGHPHIIEVEDFRKAQADAIAPSAAKIIAHLKTGGEKTVQALKSLCWRCKGIQVEEAMIIGVDALGFDMRVCSGTQLQTLRFAFDKKATSECSAERQLNDLLFPRTQHKSQKKKRAQHNDC